MTHAQRAEFEKLALPLIEWLNKNGNPHMTIVIDQTSAEVLSGELSIYTEAFLKD